MYLVPRDRSIEVHAAGKINLFLEVIARRPDGFHEIETLMSAVSIYDTLTITPRAKNSSARPLDFSCRWAHAYSGDALPPAEHNLAYRALQKLEDAAGRPLLGQVRLVKRIPAAAGLGGASADAAAVLAAGNLAWKLDLSPEQLAEIAAHLGSDIPFFLSEGAAVCRGRGEQIEPFSAPPLHIVVVRPPVGLSTPAVYKQCTPNPTPRSVDSLMQAWSSGKVNSVAAALYNRLEQAASSLTPWIAQSREAMLSVGSLGCRMSGSGTSYFGVFASAYHARRAAARLRAGKAGSVFCATTLSAGSRRST